MIARQARGCALRVSGPHGRPVGAPRRCATRAVAPPTAAAASESPLLKDIAFINPAFKGVASEAQFIGLLQKVVASGKCPPQLLPLWQDFFNNYKAAIMGSGQEGANEKLVSQARNGPRADGCRRGMHTVTRSRHGHAWPLQWPRMHKHATQRRRARV